MPSEKDETQDSRDLGVPPPTVPTGGTPVGSDGNDNDAQGGIATAAAGDDALSEAKCCGSQDRPPRSDPTSEQQRLVGESSPSPADGGSIALEMDKNSAGEKAPSSTFEDRDNKSGGDNGGEGNYDVDGADDEQGPPPLVLERQPSASAPKPGPRRAPARTASSASSQDSFSSTAPAGTAGAAVPYRSVRDMFLDTGGAAAVFPVAQLRKLATAGSLDSSHRGVSWRVLLGYLGPDRSRWPADLQKQRQLYRDLCRQVFVHPIDDGAELKQRGRRPPSSRGSRLTEDGSHSATSSNHGADDDAVGEGADGRRSTNGRESSPAAAVGGAAPSAAAAASSSPPQPVPQAVRDAWKRSGRDAHVLESVCSGINALRLPETSGTDPPSSEEEVELSCRDFINTASLLDEIRKDVVRTCSDLSFYLDPALGMRRYAVLERILLISATLSNRAVRYVQGMNEIVAILYFVLTSRDEEDEDDDDDEDHDGRGGDELHEEGVVASDLLDVGSDSFSDVALGNEEDNVARRNEETTDCWADHAEPDAYWLFHALLSEMSDVFVPDMDSAETGIQGRIAAMQELLKRHDMETAEHLEEIGIDTGFYAVRWWTTLLSREFRLPDTVRLWDSMFASTHKDNFIRYVCVTMVLIIRDSLLKADFSTCLRMLQSYPPTNMEQLLQSSRALWVYESQITVACHRGGISLHQALQTIAPPPGVVFAFGLRNGILQSRDKEVETKTAELKVREATQAVASQAQVILGRARGLYSRSVLEYRKYRSASTASSANSDAKNNSDGHDGRATVGSSKSQDAMDAHVPDDPDDSIYMEAILKA